MPPTQIHLTETPTTLAPFSKGEREVLWACLDGSADFGSAIPETDFVERLSPAKREEIVQHIIEESPGPFRLFEQRETVIVRARPEP